MTHRRGEVVWYPAVFAEYDRPFLVVSTDAHPFHGEEHVGLAVTTTAHESAVAIDEGDWELGSLPKPSHVKPWNPVILKHEEVVGVAGAVAGGVVDDVVTGLFTVCGGT
jgi:hypothetical protein